MTPFSVARRSAEYDVETAWRALLASASPKELLSPATSAEVRRLFEAREGVRTGEEAREERGERRGDGVGARDHREDAIFDELRGWGRG